MGGNSGGLQGGPGGDGPAETAPAPPLTPPATTSTTTRTTTTTAAATTPPPQSQPLAASAASAAPSSGGPGAAAVEEELFCLKWNDYQENVVSTLAELREQEDFFDVTLICQGQDGSGGGHGQGQGWGTQGQGGQVRAHKLVLSACSHFFRRLLRSMKACSSASNSNHPVIVLWDVDYQDLVNIIDFMYNGEIKASSVPSQLNISSLLTFPAK